MGKGRYHIIEDRAALEDFAKTHTTRECAEAFGVSYATMWNTLFDYRIKAVRGGWRDRYNTFDRNKEIWRKRKSGKSYEELGREYGLTKQRIGHICRRQRERENEGQ